MSIGHSSTSRRPMPYRRGTADTNWRTLPTQSNRGRLVNARRPGAGLSTVVLTDICASARRDHQSQRRMRQDMYEILRDVVRYVGLDLDSLHTTDNGDGLRLLFPASLLEPIRVARLIEAESLRGALAADDQIDLAAIVSDGLFETVLRHGNGYIRPSCFREIHLTVKEFAAKAWQLVPSGGAGICGRCYRSPRESSR